MRRLILRPGAMGDFIVSLPAMESLRQAYIEVWARGANAALARFADRSRAIASTGLDLLGVVEPDGGLMETLRGFDEIVSWYGSNRPEFREAVRGLPFRFLTALPEAGWKGHACDFYLEQVGAPPGLAPRIACKAQPRDAVVIQPFAGSAKKRWPLERFRELAARMRTPVEWCRGPEDALPGARTIEDLYMLAEWLAGARLVIANDSGVAHLAAAVGTPVAVLFGPTDPGVWAPRGRDVRVIAKTSMEEIAVEEVVARIRDRCDVL